MITIQQLSRSFLVASLLVTATSIWADQNTEREEAKLLAVLRSDAPSAEKAITCKKLAIHGSIAAVPDLAKLLPDPHLSSWARTALEVIPGDEADEALRVAADSLDGRLLVGMINSIGFRRDADAVDSLTKRLQDTDADVASAAAVALGRIGNREAATALRQSLADAPTKVRSAIAEGCVLCAERFAAEGNDAESIAIYDQVRSADVPEQRLIEATRGAILARGQEGIPLLLEQFRSDDRARFRLALGIAREFPGKEIDQTLATELASAKPERAALMIHAMADRTDTVVLAAILTAAEAGPKQVRLAAIGAINRVGDDSCLASLMTTAMEADAELAEAAKETLAGIPGQQVDQQIVALLSNTDDRKYALLLELVGRRRIAAVSDVLKGLDHSNSDVRSAALTALGETVSLDQMSTLISQVVSATHDQDQQIAQKALRAASVRMPDREACAKTLAAAFDRSSTETKSSLLEIVSEVGGTNALQTVSAAAKSGNPALLDTGSRLLGKWDTIDAAPVLLDLAKTAKQDKYKIRSLRGYLGLARKFANGKERAEMCQNAIDSAVRLDEQQLAIQVLTLRPSAAGLSVAVKAQELPTLKQDATNAVLTMAQKLSEQGVDVKQMISSAGLRQVNLEIVKAEYGSGSTQKDVTKTLQKQADDVPLITLESPSYNTSFGGDPTPGVVKQLTIEYRINGKVSEASFAENALILLPLPN